ncbi:MAG: choice-of-anchor J domain-containing protein [Ferruginibacter sp.]
MMKKGHDVPANQSQTVLKRNRLKLFILLFTVLQCLHTTAQNKKYTKPPLKRCGTMEALAEEIKRNPALKQRIIQGKKDYQNSLLANPAARPGTIVSLPGPVTIPVVVHIVLPNPWLVTDDAVQRFIDKLNEDYAGVNADSTNAAAFYPVRGHSLLRFTLAKRDPAGKFTTGIVRVAGSTQITQTTDQEIKHSSTPTGGSTGWDVTKYYNIFIGDGSAANLLGIAPEIGPGGPATAVNADGVCIDYRSLIGNCYGFTVYNKARTAVHEIGHNFGLYHPFDDGCASDDFDQLTSAGCSLPAALLAPADDVPIQADATRECPQPGFANNCTPSQPRMYQNYMDYTYDACYSMFSKGEVKRMEWVLENCRPSYLTTNGGQYPDNMPALDAAIHSIVNPGGFDFDSMNCRSVKYPDLNCPGDFAPQIRIVNQGTDTLTSITVTGTVNNGNPVSKTFALKLATGKSQVLQLPTITTTLGTNHLQFQLSAPNNGADAAISNDTSSITFEVAALLPLPYTESFEPETFPPANGSVIVNHDGDITWARTTAAGNPGNASLYIDLYEYGIDKEGERDLYRLPKINVDHLDSLLVEFNVAYRQYFGADVTAVPNDSLRIVYSTDCGNSWLPTDYVKGGKTLSTVSIINDSAFFPTSADEWRKEKLLLKNFCAGDLGSIILGFESVNQYGNNIFIDNIEIKEYRSFDNNAALLSIEAPLPALCNESFTPRIKFGNKGMDNLKSVLFHYQIDYGTLYNYKWTGNLAKCDSAITDLPAVNTLPGTHRLLVYLSNPNDVQDESVQNDTLAKTFTVYTTTAMPLVEGFEDAGFPGTNWGVQNVNGGTSFERSVNAAKSGNASIQINNPNAENFNNAIDYLISPIIKNNGLTDSVFVDFDLAYKAGPNDPGSVILPLDTLEILTTTDCGETFTGIWKKWGNSLQTVTGTGTAAFTPAKSSDWRHERIYLTPFTSDIDFQLYFAMRGNKQNNLWLDNINISSLTLPPLLKQQGYLIYPNPNNGRFVIHHYATDPPVNLKSVQVYTITGQLIWQKEYNGNAERKIMIDLKNNAKGTYMLKIIYKNKTVVEKIIRL